MLDEIIAVSNLIKRIKIGAIFIAEIIGVQSWMSWMSC